MLSTKTREDTANTRTVYSGAGTSGEKLLSLLSTKNKRRYSEYTHRVFGCGDARREATFFTVHQKQEKIQRIHAPCIRVRGRAERSYFLYCPPKTRDLKIQRIHAPCIRVRGRAERSYFLYCPPKTREDTANTRTVYSGAGTRVSGGFALLYRSINSSLRNDYRGQATLFTVHQKQAKVQRIHAPCIRVWGTRGEKLLSLLSTKNRKGYSEYTRHVFDAGTRGEKILSLLSTKNKRLCGEYTRRVFGCGDARRRAERSYFLFNTVIPKQEKIQRIHAPCIRVLGRAERSYFLYCPPKTRDGAANTRCVFGCGDARREATFFSRLYCPPKKQENMQRI